MSTAPPRPLPPALPPVAAGQVALAVRPTVLTRPATPTPPSPPIPDVPKTPAPVPAPGLYDLPALLARIVSVSAALHAAGKMQLGVPEPRPTRPPILNPEPSLAGLAVGASVLLDDRPPAKAPPPPVESMLAALPVYHWRDWHRPVPLSSELEGTAPETGQVPPLPRSYSRPDHPAPATDSFPPKAGGCKCPQCHVADPSVALRGMLARQRHLRFEPSSEEPTLARAPPDPSKELVRSARLAVDRWKSYRSASRDEPRSDG